MSWWRRLLLGGGQAPRFHRDVVTTFATQICTLLASLANAALLARCLGPAGRGQVALALTVPSLLSLALGLGVGVANVFYTGRRQFSRETLAANTVALMLMTTAISLFLGAVLVSTRFLEWTLPGLPAGLLLLACAALPFALLEAGFSGILQGMQRIRTLNLVAFARTTMNLGVALVLVAVLRRGLVGAIMASISASALAVCLLFVALEIPMQALLPRWERGVMWAVISFGVRGQLGNVFQFLNYRLDTFIVNYYQGAASVGIYAAGVSLAELLWQAPNAVGFVIFPKAASSGGEAMNQFTPRVFRATLVLMLLGTACLAAAGQPAIRLLYSSAFLSAYGPMLLLLPGVALLGSGRVITNELAGRGKPLINSMNALLSLVVTVALDLILIPRHGIVGAAAASSISYALTFAVAVGCFLRVSGLSLRALFRPDRADLEQLRRIVGGVRTGPRSPA